MQGTQNSYEDGAGTPPQVIADIVARAIKARKPKTRYVAGKYAKPSLFVRKWFGDRFFDRMIMRML